MTNSTRVKLDTRTWISLGTLIATIGILAPILVYAVTAKADINRNREWIDENKVRLEQLRMEVKDELKEISSKLDDLKTGLLTKGDN